jgi:hypothetical protein
LISLIPHPADKCNYQKKYFLATDSAVAQGYGGQVHGFSLVIGEWMLDTRSGALELFRDWVCLGLNWVCFE